MAITYLNNISLDNNEIKNVKIDNKTTTQRNQMTPEKGHMIFNSTDNLFQFYDGSQWINLNDTDTDEDIQDLIGGMLSGNTETNIEVTYDDANDKINFVVSDSVIRGKISVGSEGSASGNGSLAYNNSTGVLTYTPPVLSGLSGDSDDISEGSSNLYFTNARARGAISVTDSGGDGSLAYNSSTGVITYTGPSAAEVRAHFSAGTGVSISSGQVSIGQAVGTTDNVTFNNVDVDGTLTTDAISTTNLTVTGTTTTVNTETINLADNVITLNSNLDGNTGPTQNGGIEVNRGSSSNVSLFFNESTDRWQFQNEVSGSITTYNIPTSEIDAINAGDGIDVASSGGTTTISAENATSSNPGIAAFDSTDFSIDADQVVHLAKDPTITLTGDVTGSGTMTNLGSVSITTTVSNNQSFATSIGDGSATSYEVQHSLGTKDVIVQLYDNSSNDTVFADVTRSIAAKSSPNDWIQIDFASAPSSNDIRVLVIKCA
tara:strand:- start:1924 stop:3387 length:1464 start_codon:yes stop_codon:yes gene_type:complete